MQVEVRASACLTSSEVLLCLFQMDLLRLDNDEKSFLKEGSLNQVVDFKNCLPNSSSRLGSSSRYFMINFCLVVEILEITSCLSLL